MKNDPEGTEAYLKWLYKSEGSDSGFNMGGRVGYAEGNIVEPTGYMGPSEMKTAAGYVSPYAMMTDAGYEPTNIDQAEELKRRLAEANPVYEMLFDAIERENAANGGRIGMFAGGKLIGEGIMQAAKLAQKGIKPFGKKQTYKQKVTKVGEDEFQKAMKQHFDKELYLINKVKGPRGNPEAELFDLYEEIASKQRYSMLPEATRSKMLSQIDDSLKAMDVDGGDYQNFRSYLFDEYGFPNETAFKETGSNVIPFKPRTKKAMGGQIGVGSLFRSK
jgi:hypothetical protein